MRLAIIIRETEFLEETRFLNYQSANWLAILNQDRFLRIRNQHNPLYREIAEE